MEFLMKDRTALEIRVIIQALEILNNGNMPAGVSYLVKDFRGLGKSFQLLLERQARSITTTQSGITSD